MSDTFGSPELNDATAQAEKQITRAVDLGVKAIETDLPRIAPRPIGTQRAKPEDIHFDWKNRGPDYWGLKYQEAVAQSPTLGDAVIELLKHDREMQEREDGST